MSDFTIRPATRQGVKPLIALYGESGTGKTYSALLLARGLVGPSGKILMVDTESGRGSLYADVLPGGYDVIEMREPFSPERYIGAIQAAEASGAGVLLVDSGSHEWEGIGGVLDMAGENEAKSGKAGLHNWKGPKMAHAKFMLKLLQSPLPIVVCLRAKYKTRQTKDERGKTAIVKDDHTSPIQADDFIFEATAHAEILHDHSIRLTKCSHPALRSCFPEAGPITVEHGQKIAAWCNAAALPVGASASGKAQGPADPIKTLKAALWAQCAPFRGASKTWDEAEKQLRTWKILPDALTVRELTESDLQEVIDKLTIQLSQT